jgi:hypothetical protein
VLVRIEHHELGPRLHIGRFRAHHWHGGVALIFTGAHMGHVGVPLVLLGAHLVWIDRQDVPRPRKAPVLRWDGSTMGITTSSATGDVW